MNAKKNLVIDLVALVVYLLVATPALTGVPLHEWLSLGLLVVLFVHVVAHVPWIVDAASGMRQTTGSVRGNLVLDVLILGAFAVVMVSGFGISGEVMRTFGYYAQGYYFWNPLHAVAAKVLLALLLVHVVVHVKWSYQVLRGNGIATSRKSDGGDVGVLARGSAKESEGHHGH